MSVSDGQPSDCSFVPLHAGLMQALHVIIAATFIIVFGIICVCYTKVALTIKRKLIQNRVITQGQYQLKAGTSSKNSDSKSSFRISRHREVAPMGSIETSCSTGAPEPFRFSQGNRNYN